MIGIVATDNQASLDEIGSQITYGIGRGDGELLYDAPDDRAIFKITTSGGIVIMGRKTYESLPTKKLSNRILLVLTSKAEPMDPKDYGKIFEKPVWFVNEKDMFGLLTNVNTICHKNKNFEFPIKVYLAGGEEVYKRYMYLCNKFYVSRFYKTPDVDPDKFISFNTNDFVLGDRFWHCKDFEVLYYKRKKRSYNREQLEASITARIYQYLVNITNTNNLTRQGVGNWMKSEKFPPILGIPNSPIISFSGTGYPAYIRQYITMDMFIQNFHAIFESELNRFINSDYFVDNIWVNYPDIQRGDIDRWVEELLRESLALRFVRKEDVE